MFLPVSRFTRRFFDFDNLFGRTLDLFDPFDEHDLSLYPSTIPSITWVNPPPAILDSRGRRRPPPEKFRVTMNVSGYDKHNIKSAVENGKLVITGKQTEKCEKTGDFHDREFRRSFEIPENAIVDKLTSFITPNGILVVEIPLKVEEKHSTEVAPVKGSLFDFDEFFTSGFGPKIKDTPEGKKIQMEVDVKNYKPEDIHVSLKDNELIVKAESSSKDKNSFIKSHYYKQVTLPPGTDVEHLNSTFENGKLEITAPYKEPTQHMIEEKKKEEALPAHETKEKEGKEEVKEKAEVKEKEEAKEHAQPPTEK